MATLTKEQIEQKVQQLKQLNEEMITITNELVEGGVIKLSEEELDQVTGGGHYEIIGQFNSTEDLLKILRTQPGLSLGYIKFVDKGTDAPQQLGRKSPFS